MEGTTRKLVFETLVTIGHDSQLKIHDDSL